MIGRTVSHYRITDKLGEGGMGIVYLAEDTSLKRKVALKFLPASLADDEVAHKRFLREARSAAALDHPFICNIYEVSRTEDGENFICMEYVEGQTLRESLAQAPLPLREALQIGVEIAQALEKAHSSGIVHRDLKPANIMLTADGHPKVMDFGLAKKVITEEGKEEDVTAALTREGSTLGTLAYMSPEQVKAQPVDHRSDIFSFGILLYEMLTRVHPFRSGTQAETITAILSEHPSPISRYTEDTPEILEHTVEKMLAKEPDDRYQSVHEIRSNLKKLSDGLGTAEAIYKTVGVKRIGWRRSVLAALTLAAVASITGILYWSPWQTTPELPPPETIPLTSFPGIEVAPELSPDGQYVAFSWRGVDQENWDIYIQLIGEAEPHRLTSDPASEDFPTWSPDGSRIAFLRSTSLTEHVLYVVPVVGGSETKVADSTFEWNSLSGGLSWSPVERELIAMVDQSAPDEPASIFLVSLETREKRQLTSPPKGAWDAWPRFSPDGRTVAFFRIDAEGSHICLQHVQAGEARYLITEPLLYVRGLDWTADGSAVVVILSKAMSQDAYLVKVPLAGGEPERLPFGEDADWVTVARSGGRLVYTRYESNMNLWRVSGPNSSGTVSSARFAASSTRNEQMPVYSPDGKKVAFRSDRSGDVEIWRSDAEGRDLRKLTDLGGVFMGDWSPGSNRIAFLGSVTGAGQDILIIDDIGGVAQPHNLTPDEFIDAFPSWSPDGQWIYYQSLRDGVQQIFKIAAEGGSPVQLTQKGGEWPQVAEDGRVFFSRDWKIWNLPLDGREEVLVLDNQISTFFWSTWKDNIVYFSEETENTVIEMFNLSSGDITTLYTLETERTAGGAPTVSPDGEWILFMHYKPSADLMLVENFR